MIVQILLFYTILCAIIFIRTFAIAKAAYGGRIYLSASLLSFLHRQRKGGVAVDNIFLSFMISVIAGVVTHYICKWLDR
jgi:multisubunit Na+/H+ antiporter MnhG subunit